MVIPKLAAERDSASMARAMSPVPGDGMRRLTSPEADSLSRPVGTPPASRSITPRGGSAVAAVTPASFSATELASA